MIICTKCNLEKDDNCFSKGQYWCKSCCKQYRLDNKESIKNTRQVYLISKKDIIKEKRDNYYLNNRDTIIEKQTAYNTEHQEDIKKYQKQYHLTNKEDLKAYNKKYQYPYRKKRKIIDPNFRLRLSLSTAIHFSLKRLVSSKHGKSFIKYLPYSMQDLKDYLEKQFESWMTWDNWGIYNPKTWDDNNQTTWTWQIDHIIPCSNFQYTSMEDQAFKDCWGLTNLRPYSAKQNIIDKDRK